MTKSRYGFYCSCGVAMYGEIGPVAGVEDLRQLFEIAHWSKDGHEPVTAKQAAVARRKQERQRDRGRSQ